jgi:hypothetical protein
LRYSLPGAGILRYGKGRPDATRTEFISHLIILLSSNPEGQNVSIRTSSPHTINGLLGINTIEHKAYLGGGYVGGGVEGMVPDKLLAIVSVSHRPIVKAVC